MVVRCWTTTCHQNIFSVTLIQVSENLQAALNTFFPKDFPLYLVNGAERRDRGM